VSESLWPIDDNSFCRRIVRLLSEEVKRRDRQMLTVCVAR
jgi:hypothetical protein